MNDAPDNWNRFISSRYYRAKYKSDSGEEEIIIEVRANAIDEFKFFSIVMGEKIVASYLMQFAMLLPNLISLEIPHSLQVMWSNNIYEAQLLEIFQVTETDSDSKSCTLRLELKVDQQVFQTEPCDTLQDAVWELDGLIGDQIQWQLRTCFHCYFSGHARDYITGDREYWCYRDSSIYPERRNQWKSVDPKIRFDADFYVNAFHTCAAWRPYNG